MKRAAPRGGPFSCRLTASALLRALTTLIGAPFAAGLAVLAALLLLLAITISLRPFLVVLVGVVSHFPSPFAAYDIVLRHPINPPMASMLPAQRQGVAVAGQESFRGGNRRGLDRFIR